MAIAAVDAGQEKVIRLGRKGMASQAAFLVAFAWIFHLFIFPFLGGKIIKVLLVLKIY